jgi:hypothetical protein
LRQTFREFDGHQVFEEIRGVLAAGAGGVLSRDAYLALGVRQSIFPVDQRDRLYDLFEKYRTGWPRRSSTTSISSPRTGRRWPRRATTSWSSTRCRTSPPCNWRWSSRR